MVKDGSDAVSPAARQCVEPYASTCMQPVSEHRAGRPERLLNSNDLFIPPQLLLSCCLTAFDLHPAGLRVVRVIFEVHWTRENQSQPEISREGSAISIMELQTAG